MAVADRIMVLEFRREDRRGRAEGGDRRSRRSARLHGDRGMSENKPILSTHGLIAGYGDFQALFSVDFEIAAGEIVALIGANGAGKSTFLRADHGAVAGRAERWSASTASRQAERQRIPWCARGSPWCSKGRRLFTGMTVEDNLRVAIDNAPRCRCAVRKSRHGRWNGSMNCSRFSARSAEPEWRISPAASSKWSPSDGLCCVSRASCSATKSRSGSRRASSVRSTRSCRRSPRPARRSLLVEQDVRLAQKASNRLYCMLEGRITLTGKSADIHRDDIAQAYFGTKHAVA